MIRSILRSLIFLLFSTVAIAQSTTVSATVVDSDSTAWANGTWSISFVPSQSFPNLSSYTCNGSALTTSYKGTLNGSGAFSQAMCTGSFTAPGGGSWNISICPNSSAPCGLLNFTTAGSTLDLSSAITAVIPAPRFAAVAGAYGYADVEAALALRPGATYWNVTSGAQKCYNASTPAWGACSAGGGGNVVSPSTTGISLSDTSTEGVTTTEAGTGGISLTDTGGGGVNLTSHGGAGINLQDNADGNITLGAGAILLESTQGVVIDPFFLPFTFYSAAGTPLPACSGLGGARAVVSDATLPTYLGIYVSGGAVTAPVFCNGTNWLTD